MVEVKLVLEAVMARDQGKGKKYHMLDLMVGIYLILEGFPRGFNCPTTKNYQVVNLSQIEKINPSLEEINPEFFKQNNLIDSENKRIKVLATSSDSFRIKATFIADSFSAKDKEKIENAGGKIKIREKIIKSKKQ